MAAGGVGKKLQLVTNHLTLPRGREMSVESVGGGRRAERARDAMTAPVL